MQTARTTIAATKTATTATTTTTTTAITTITAGDVRSRLRTKNFLLDN